jgi:MFS family permease
VYAFRAYYGSPQTQEYDAVMQARHPIRQALANREIRLAETGWMLGIAAEAAYLVALLVFAFQLGGIGWVGLAGLARTLPGALSAPFVGSLADRLPRHRLLLVVHLGRAAAVAGLALLSTAGGSPFFLVVLAGAEGIFATLHRPANVSLLPALARSPEELIASNIVSGTAENLGTLIGPALGSGVLLLAGTTAGFVLPTAMFLAAAVAVGLVRPMAQPRVSPGEGGRRGIRRVLRGFEALIQHPTAGVLVGVALTQTFVRGLITVLLVAACAGVLGLGEQGIGLLQSAVGFGGIAGALAAGAVVSRRHLSGAMRIGLVLWGLPIVVIGLVPNAIVAVLVLAVLGIGNAVFDVGLFSLIQRNVPNAVRGSVFGAFEGMIMLTVGLGSILAPVLEKVLGVQGALVAAGAVLPVLALAAGRAIERADHAAVVPDGKMRLLRGVPMFRPLPLTVVEQLAMGAQPAVFDADSAILKKGEVGDRFYIVVSGEADVMNGKRRLRHLEPGDSFGEIALLRDSPRTATVRAVGRVETLTLHRVDFVCAVTGNPQAATAAGEVIEGRLDASPSAGPA